MSVTGSEQTEPMEYYEEDVFVANLEDPAKKYASLTKKAYVAKAAATAPIPEEEVRPPSFIGSRVMWVGLCWIILIVIVIVVAVGASGGDDDPTPAPSVAPAVPEAPTIDVEPTPPAPEPTDPPVEPTDPPVEPTDPPATVAPTDPPVAAPTEPPTAAPVDVEIIPNVTVTVAPTEDVDGTTDPPDDTDVPVVVTAAPTDPPIATAEPTDTPIIVTAEPTDGPDETGVPTGSPTIVTSAPTVGTEAPVAATAEPTVTPETAEPTTAAPTDAPTAPPTTAEPTVSPTATPTETTPEPSAAADSPTAGLVELDYVGNNGEPPEAFPLQVCQGDCDDDDECAEGLVCFERETENDAVPGCFGLPANGDYCILAPSTAPVETDAPTPDGPVDLVAVLPDYTQEALQDPTSPQAFAFLFVNYDPNYDTRTQRQLVQRFSLATLYFGLGRSWTDGAVLPAQDECTWFEDTGSFCNEDGMMEALLLENNNLEGGPIPAEIGLLTDLKQVDMSSNFITGTIPTYLGQLQMLESLSLAQNELMMGTVPTELAAIPTLQTLDLTGLDFVTGVIPEGLCEVEGLMFDCSESLCGCDCACAR